MKSLLHWRIARPPLKIEHGVFKSESKNLQTARTKFAASSNSKYAIFAGGNSGINSVEAISDSLVSTNVELQSARYYLKAARIDDYCLFAGGRLSNSQRSANVDCYDSNLVHTILDDLNIDRYYISSASTDDYAIFAGGYTPSTNITTAYNSNLVKVTPPTLSVARYSIQGASVNNKAIFAGGWTSKPVSTVDCLDNQLVLTQLEELTTARYDLSSITLNNTALFGGGKIASGYTATIETYNSQLVKSTAPDLLLARRYLTSAIAKNGDLEYGIFAGGYNGTYLATVDCYNSNLAKVELDDLSVGRQELEGASIGNYAIFAGGANKAGNQGLIDIYACK